MRSIRHLAAFALRTLRPGSACAALLLGLAVGQAVQAAIVPVNGSNFGELTSDPTNFVLVDNGNLKLSNFQFMPSSTGGAIAPDPATISLFEVNTGSTFGLTFAGGQFRAGTGQSVDAILTFDVTSQNPATSIDSAELSFSAVGTGSGSASIIETVTNGTTQLGGKSMLVIEAADMPPTPADAISFTGQTTIHVHKDILMQGTAFVTNGDSSNLALMSDFTQTFDVGDGPPAPEPASLGLMLIGGAGLVWYGRRRRGKVARTLVRA